MAQTKANANANEGLLERVVTGPKPIHCTNYKTGERYVAKVGDTVWLTPQHAKSKARYLQSPAVAKALDVARKAEEAEAEKEAPPPAPSAPSISVTAGGDSAES